MFLQSQILYLNPHFSSCAQICLGSVQLAGRDLLAFLMDAFHLKVLLSGKVQQGLVVSS